MQNKGENLKNSMIDEIQKWIIGIVVVIVGIIVVFNILAGTSSSLVEAATNASNSGLPLANVLFAPGGILLMLFVVGVFIALMLGIFKMFKK